MYLRGLLWFIRDADSYAIMWHYDDPTLFFIGNLSSISALNLDANIFPPIDANQKSGVHPLRLARFI